MEVFIMSEILKIGLVGSAGIGKGSVASKLSEKLGIVFLKSKDITRPVLKKYNYDYLKNECVEKFLSRKEIEFELVSSRIKHESSLNDGFITDRTTLECFVYALLSVEKYTDDEIITLEKKCFKNMRNYSHIFYFPYQNGWLENNGLRTVNTFFQWKIDLMIRGMMDDWNIKAVTVNADNPVDFILENLKHGC